METKWEAKNFHKNFHEVLERGVEVEIKRHTTYFREQIELWVGPKKEVENPWTSPNKVYFSSRWPPLGARKSAPKKLKNNFLQYTWKLEEVQNLVFLLILFLQIFPDAVSMNSLIYVYSIQIPSWSHFFVLPPPKKNFCIIPW